MPQHRRRAQGLLANQNAIGGHDPPFDEVAFGRWLNARLETRGERARPSPDYRLERISFALGRFANLVICVGGDTRRHWCLYAEGPFRQIAAARGCENCFGPVLDAKLVQYSPMELDRAFKHPHLTRNFLIGFPFPKHDHNFMLARREPAASISRPRCQPFGPQHSISMVEAKCTGRDVDFPQQDKRQSMLEDARLRRRRKVTARSAANGGDNLRATFAGRRDNDGYVGKLLDHPSQSREVFHSGHACTERHKVEIRQPRYKC